MRVGACRLETEEEMVAGGEDCEAVVIVSKFDVARMDDDVLGCCTSFQGC